MVERVVSMVLIRHGQSTWNSERRWQGRADSPLTRLGERQARQCSTALVASRWPLHAVWSSPLGRARQTADIIAGRLGLEPVQIDDRLAESDAGEWEGLTRGEIEARYPGFLGAHRRPPTFESFESVVGRAHAALLDIAAVTEDGPIAVVSHSGLIRSLVRSCGEPDWRVPNLGGVWFDVRVDGSVTDDHIRLGDRFDPGGVTGSGVDAGGEDPGDQTDQADTHRAAES